MNDPTYLTLAAACETDSGYSSWLITADWLEENGHDDLAEAYRWCEMEGKRPYYYDKFKEFWWMEEDYNQDECNFLPRQLYVNILRPESKDTAIVVEFNSFPDAMHALAVALKRWEEFKLKNRRAVREHAEMRIGNLATV